MPKGLKRYYGQDHLHFLTCSCYHRQPWLASGFRRDLFLEILEQTRQRYRFVVAGYVIMPDHIHLLLSEPEQGTPSTVMQVLKQRFARRVLGKKRRNRAQTELWPASSDRVWQRRRVAKAFDSAGTVFGSGCPILAHFARVGTMLPSAPVLNGKSLSAVRLFEYAPPASHANRKLVPVKKRKH